MEPTQRGRGVPRPILPDAPEWFNRARIRANRRETFQLPTSSRTFDATLLPAWVRTRSLIALSPVALAIAFLAGFGAHGWIGRGLSESAQGPDLRVAAATPAAVADPRAAAPRADERRAVLPAPAHGDGAAPPAVPAVHPEVQRALEPPRVAVEAPPAPRPLEGFELRAPGGKEIVADVRVPDGSWFGQATAGPDCDSGTCKVVPLKVADRKLGTALEWCSSPEAAAAQAEREGKLVFLIHVSGNFAQAGFT